MSNEIRFDEAFLGGAKFRKYKILKKKINSWSQLYESSKSNRSGTLLIDQTLSGERLKSKRSHPGNKNPAEAY